MPRPRNLTTPKLDDFQVTEVERALAVLFAKQKPRSLAKRRLGRLLDDIADKRDGGRLFRRWLDNMYVRFCQDHGREPRDMNEFLAWLKETIIKYGPIALQILSLVLMFI